MRSWGLIAATVCATSVMKNTQDVPATATATDANADAAIGIGIDSDAARLLPR